MDSPATKHSYSTALCTPGCGHLFLNMYIIHCTCRGFLWYGAGVNLEFLFSQIYMIIFFNRVLVIAQVLPYGHLLYVA